MLLVEKMGGGGPGGCRSQAQFILASVPTFLKMNL